MAVQPPVRIPFVWDYNPRGVNSLNARKDAWRVNVMDEAFQDVEYTTQRPGLSRVVDPALPWFGSSYGQGIMQFKNGLVGVVDDALNFTSTLVTGANILAATPTFNAPWFARYALAGCVYNGRIYITGGLNSTTRTGDIWSTADIATGAHWRCDASSAPWGLRVGGRLVVHNNVMFFVGGSNLADDGVTVVYHNDVWSSIDGVAWTQVTPGAAFLGRASFGLVSFGGNLVLTGGESLGFTFDDVWASADGETWNRVATASYGPLSHHGMVVYNDAMLVVGGYNGGAPVNNTWASTDGGVTWVLKTAATFSSPRMDMGLVNYAGAVYAIGGLTAPPGLTSSSQVYVSNNDGSAWTLISTVFGTSGLAVAVQFPAPSTDPNPGVNTIYVIGGVTSGSATNRVSYAVPNRQPFGSITPTVTGEPYQFSSFNNGATLIFKNGHDFWVMDSWLPVMVDDNGYPVETVPGLVTLGDFAYVMDRSGLIHNCEIANAKKWPSLNVVGADFTDDEGVYLARYKNYVVALGTYTTQLFYDAGLSAGSPLLPVLNANTEIGCAHASTVAKYEDTLIWVSQTRDGNRQVVMMNGTVPTAISNLAVDKYLSQFAADTYALPLQGCLVGLPGHQFYILNAGFPRVAIDALEVVTWVYDLRRKKWVQWLTDAPVYKDNGLPFLFAASDGNYALHPMDGTVYQLSYTDVVRDEDSLNYTGADYPVRMYGQTQPIDGGTMRIKFWGRMDVVCQQADDLGSARLLSLRSSDDGGTTQTAWRTVDLRSNRPQLTQNGSSRRRIWEFLYAETVRERFEALEAQLEVQPT